ncbi:Cell division control protein 6 like [Glycine soja]|uniref:Cell division control protein 6 like n=1 Tax=Glycine soja TaxID=3848 RepID=A0A0B2P295_GLYSO|nr:Cell division control protein 6 like [Glycine soja]
MEKVKDKLLIWAKEAGLPQPDVLSVNCTTFTNTSDIFTKILGLNQTQGKKVSATPLQQLQNMYSQKSSNKNMTLIVADELDYLITKDRGVLHDLFMLTTFPFSRCILIGVANAIDLADRFLPRLTSLNCKPIVVNFRAYSKDQILKILEERLNELPYTVFQQQAMELCARKVAAASGDMRNALCICGRAIEMLEAEIRESACNLNTSLEEISSSRQNLATAPDFMKKREFETVRTDHMARALSKTYRSPVVDTIQSLPHHQQIVLCSSMKHFRGAKKDTILGELYKSYVGVCKSCIIPPAGILEFSNMCRVLNDQGLIKLGQSREDKLRRVSPKVDEGDITFALQVYKTGDKTESVSGQEEEEELNLWNAMVEEASRMEGLDRDVMKRFVSPVMARIESDDYAEYLRTELVYQTGLSQDPSNTLLLVNYAQFLYLVVHDFDRAEELFKRAIEVEPPDAEAYNKYAKFLWKVKNDLWAAEETYLEAISADPDNAFYAADYAHFLWNTGGEDTCFPLSSPDNSKEV